MKLLSTLLVLTFLVGCSDPTGGGEKTVERYDNGQKKSEGYLLDDGTEVGLWVGWHESGQKKEEGSYKNGKEEGLWTYWHNNEQKMSEGSYKNGQLEGLWFESSHPDHSPSRRNAGLTASLAPPLHGRVADG